MKRFAIICLFIASTLSCHSQSSTPHTRDSLSLYIFLLDDCPICLDYTITLKELYHTFGNEVTFVGYFPNFSSKPEKIESFKTTFDIPFPLYTDYYKLQAKKWDVEVTPEVVLYNHSVEKIVYKGRIDNKFVTLGRRRNVVTENDLENALIGVLKGMNLEEQYKKPVGCFINYGEMARQQEDKR